MSLFVIVQAIFTAIRWLIYARIILSFLPLFTRVDPYNPIVRFIYETTEPMMAPFRRILPPMGGFDFSIILLFFILQFVERVVYQLLGSMGI